MCDDIEHCELERYVSDVRMLKAKYECGPITAPLADDGRPIDA